jgi:hypothetical protein
VILIPHHSPANHFIYLFIYLFFFSLRATAVHCG